MNRRQYWVIDIASYGQFVVWETESDAEDTRKAKASWEGSRGKKRLLDHRLSEDRELVNKALADRKWQKERGYPSAQEDWPAFGNEAEVCCD